MHLTEKTVGKLAATEKRAQFPDDEQTGFGVRVEAAAVGGRKTFFFYKKLNGRPRWRAIGVYPQMTVKDARERARKLAVLCDEWKRAGFPAISDPLIDAPPEPATKCPTFGQLVEAYVTERVRSEAKNVRRAEYDVRSMVRKHFSSWTDKRLDALSHSDLLAVKRACGEHRVASNRCVEFARRVLNWSGAKKDGQVNFHRIAQGNFALEVSTYEEKERQRFLSAEELVRFNAALEEERNTDLKHFLVLSLNTGARKSDLCAMRWQDVDWQRRIWRIPAPKAGEPYNVQLLDAAIAVLEERHKNAASSSWVFPSASRLGHLQDVPKKAWNPFRKKCGLTDFHIHDLRHTAASWMAIAGVPLQQIGKSLGHKSLGSTARYSHLIDESIREGREAGQKKMIEMMRQVRRNRKALPAKT
jgi:integrase